MKHKIKFKENGQWQNKFTNDRRIFVALLDKLLKENMEFAVDVSYSDEVCRCLDCFDSDKPCSGDCDADEECTGCWEARMEREEQDFEALKAQYGGTPDGFNS